MICEHPEKFDAVEMFEHCIRSSVAIWGIPVELIDVIWAEVDRYLSQIPEEDIEICFD